MGKAKTAAAVTGSGLGAGVAGLAIGSLAPTTLLGAFAGPIGLGVGVAAALWIKGQAHWKANEWVQKAQNPWGKQIAGIMDPLDAKRKAGTLTYADVQASRTQFDQAIRDWRDAQSLFEGRGGDHAKVIKQARAQTDPYIKDWTKTLDADALLLKPANPEDGVDEKNPPTLPADALVKAKGAADQQKKRAQSYEGRKSTILAGAKEMTGVAGKKKTLLGGL